MAPLDDLLIKRRRGALTGAERRRLDNARRVSPEYDLALLAHDVFERDGEPQPGDAERLRALVEAVERELPRVPSASRGRWRSLLRRLAPPLFVAGAAAASVGELLPQKPAAPPAGASVESAPRLAPRALRATRNALDVPPGELEPASRAPEVAPSAPETARPLPPPVPPPGDAARGREQVPSKVARVPSEREHAPSEREPVPSDRERAPSAPSRSMPGRQPEPAAAPDESAANLFRRANRLRAVDWPAAAALYVELVGRYPRSHEAGVAEVALGKWELSRGRSGDALEWFRAHQRRAPDALTAEALFGEARALESIGSHTEALGPWRRLLQLYPTSPYADVARRRLAP